MSDITELERTERLIIKVLDKQIVEYKSLVDTQKELIQKLAQKLEAAGLL